MKYRIAEYKKYPGLVFLYFYELINKGKRKKIIKTIIFDKDYIKHIHEALQNFLKEGGEQH